MITSTPSIINSNYAIDTSSETSGSDSESKKKKESETAEEVDRMDQEAEPPVSLLPFFHSDISSAFALTGISNTDIDSLRQAIIHTVTGKTDPRSSSSEAAKNLHQLQTLACKEEALFRRMDAEYYEVIGRHLFLPPLRDEVLPQSPNPLDDETHKSRRIEETEQKIPEEINSLKLGKRRIMPQEYSRRAIYQKILLRMAVRYDQCVAIDYSLHKAIEVHSKKWKDSQNPVSQQATPPQAMSPQVKTPAEHRSSFNRMLLASAELYNRIISLLQAFHLQMAKIVSSLKFPMGDGNTHEKTGVTSSPEKTEEQAEREFLYRNHAYLTGLAIDPVDVDYGVCQSMFRLLMSKNPSCKLTFMDYMKEVSIGQKVTRTILSSEPNFGAVRATFRTKYHCIVPSSLTVVRAMARYIEALAYHKAWDPEGFKAQNAPDVTPHAENVFSIPDPDRRLYNFFAATPTAYANFLTQTREERLANQLDKFDAGRMTIIDYSFTLPGATNKMVFEPVIERDGENILILSFMSQRPNSIYRPQPAAVQETLSTLKETLFETLVNPKKPKDVFNLDDMSFSQVGDHIDQLHRVRETHIKQIEEDNRQIHAMENWKNPIFELEDYVLH